MSVAPVWYRSRHVARPIRAQACTCGLTARTLITYVDGSQRVFCGPHAVVQRLQPNVTIEELSAPTEAELSAIKEIEACLRRS